MAKKKKKDQEKFLKNIVEDIVGKQSVPIIDLLLGKKDVNEFQIAKKLNLTINQTRNILYKLSDFGLVSFIKKKDKRKGWYIYFWTLNIFQSLDLLEKKLKNELENLENELKNRKQNRFYNCETCSIEVNEETALINDFTCPECEEIYQLADNTEIIKELGKKIEKIKKQIQSVSSEKQTEEEKIEKGREKKRKKAEKIKKKKSIRCKKKKEKKPRKKSKTKKQVKKKTKKKPIKKARTSKKSKKRK